jgi:hypothetical protein
MKTQFKINFDTDEIRSILIAQAVENDAIPASVEADSLAMRISPRTGVTFVPGEVDGDEGSDGSGETSTPTE